MTINLTVNGPVNFGPSPYADQILNLTLYTPPAHGPVDVMRVAMRLMYVEDPMTAAHALKHGMETLETHGWCQGQLMSQEGRVCALGAIMVGNGITRPMDHGEMKPIEMALHPTIGPAVMALATATGYNPFWLANNRRVDPPPPWALNVHTDDRVTIIHHVTAWNDKHPVYEHNDFFVNDTIVREPGRTVDEVKAGFRSAIDTLEIL
jgi:hypothetical protein